MVAGIELMGARGYDPVTASFLNVDPLAPVAGAVWGSNPYSFAGNNPVMMSDPWGLRPAADADLVAYREANQGFLAHAGDWVADNWEYFAAGAMVVAGGVLMATGVGGPVGAMLISGGISMGMQKATTGSVDPLQLALDMVPGGVVVQGLAGAGSAAYSYMKSPGPHSASGLLGEVALGGAAGVLPGPSVVGRQVSGAGVSAGQKAIGPGRYGTLPVLPSANSKLQNLSPQVVPHDYPLAQNAWIMNRDGVAVGNTNADRFAQVLNDSPAWAGPYPTKSPGNTWISNTDKTSIRTMEDNTGLNSSNQHHVLRAVHERENPAGANKKPLKIDPATWEVPKPSAGLQGAEVSKNIMEKSHLPLHRYE
ncbi:RHS repeat-associated core domain-containing protein [Rothia nasisuis]|uniref:RHS repeat-associated core domain-containing protein n=1 Tax=Rothia nasisuis TaxID=2109647 RepID=UPI001F373DEF|nr:RHS repeat-associated core domain-containing protein [Rothia nasisuis]